MRDFGSSSEIIVLISFVITEPSLIEVPSCLKKSSGMQLDFGLGKSVAVAAAITGCCSLNEMHLLIGSC